MRLLGFFGGDLLADCQTAVLQTFCRVESLNQNFDKSIKCAKEALRAWCSTLQKKMNKLSAKLGC